MEELLKTLEALRKKIITSGVERTAGLLATVGQDCDYYKKSLRVFETRDFDTLKELIAQAYQQMQGVTKRG